MQEHFFSPLDADERRSFFSGIATCSAYPHLYEWVDAGWLASLEGTLAGRPPAIDDIRVWLCGQDELTDEERARVVRAERGCLPDAGSVKTAPKQDVLSMTSWAGVAEGSTGPSSSQQQCESSSRQTAHAYTSLAKTPFEPQRSERPSKTPFEPQRPERPSEARPGSSQAHDRP